MISIKDCLKETEGDFTIQGWVKEFRPLKKIFFVKIYDGSTMDKIQCVGDIGLSEGITYGSSVRIFGSLVSSPGEEQSHEIRISEISLLGECDPDTYPIPKKELTNSYLRKHVTMRMRTQTFAAVARIRSHLTMTIHQFFTDRDFINIHTPIITTSDCEGGGEAFGLITPEGFFPTPAYLTVSGQLQGEAAALALGKIYTFGPTFRAEKSTTKRHAAEFWMIEPEISFMELPGLINLAIELLQSCIESCLRDMKRELEILNEKFPGLIEKLASFSEFKIVTYTQAISDLEPYADTFKETPIWGIDLHSEHECFLVEEIYRKPTIITDYPKEIKAFYMHENDDGETVAAMDVLLPGIGEVIGGSQREVRYDLLESKASELAFDCQWYLDLRKYGSVPHSGFGLGFDRLLSFVTGMNNIREVIPFPVTFGRISC